MNDIAKNRPKVSVDLAAFLSSWASTMQDSANNDGNSERREIARAHEVEFREALKQAEADADELEALRARVAALEAQDRGGWVRTSGWSNELYSFDRSDNEDGTFSLTVSERGGHRLVDIDRLTASDLEHIVDVVGDGVVSRPATELEAATRCEALADTQRAIIEAAERRGYELGRKHEASSPAPTVDVDAISDEAIKRGMRAFQIRLDMRAALRAIFNKGE